MENIISGIIELNKNHHTAFAFLTVATMASVGSATAIMIELFFAMMHGNQKNPVKDAKRWKYICR